MVTISIKLPANLANVLRQRQQAGECILVPWVAAWTLADHRIGGTPLTGGISSSLWLLADASKRCGGNGHASLERHQPRSIEIRGESGLAILSSHPIARDGSNGGADMPKDHASGNGTTPVTGSNKADIYLQVNPQKLKLSSPSGRYDEVALHGWRRFLRHLLIELLLIDSRPLADIPNLATSIQPLVLDTWSGCADGETRLPHATVIDRFDLQCRRSPQAVAVRMPATLEEGWTYLNLREISLRYATRLQSLDIDAGDSVAMLLSRRPESIALLLAILRLNAVYVPIDPASPAQRMSLMLADSKPALLLVDRHTSASQRQLAVDAGIPVWDIDADLDEDPVTLTGATVPQLSEQISEQTLVRSRRSARHAAYVMYTSGSTGTPKGVVIPHRAIVRLVYRQYFAPLGPKVVMLHAAPLAFDASTIEIWGPLLNGGTVVVHPEAIPTGKGLATVIQEEQVNTAWLTAALFNRLVDEDPAHLQGLRTLMTGGEALSPRHVRKALQALPGLRLINGYGPTETTTFAITGPVSEHDLDTHASVPLGRPINWTYIRILSPQGEPVPPGLPGELHIGGPGLALGYLNRPEATTERFVPDPFGHGHELLYRSGDAARWLDDGRIEYLGRLDGQLKIRGFRIEPGEIEAVLAAVPAVASAAITDECPPNGERRLVAWLVAESGHARPDDEALRAHCRPRLPGYMMPARFVWVPMLPITLNGKLDRQALQDLENTALTEDTPVTDRDVTVLTSNLSDSGQKIHADREKTPTLVQVKPDQRLIQQQVIAILRPILAIDRLHPNDNFFEVGGSSLLAAQALDALNQRFGELIGIEDFFGNPTAAAFAARIASGLAGADRGSDGTSPPAGQSAMPRQDAAPAPAAVSAAGTQPAAAASRADRSSTAPDRIPGPQPEGVPAPAATRAVMPASAPSAASGQPLAAADGPDTGADAGTLAASAGDDPRAIAIIGMAGRFPGAASIDELWQNLIAGKDGIRHFRPEELDPSLPASLTGDPDYVPARGVLDDAARFDAAFFGIGPREAELMDPQQRIFLELAWQCLEHAGHAPRDGERNIGVFAGMYNPTYFQRQLQHHPDKIAALGEFQVMLANEKDYIATRTANRLNLQGPAISVHTACSTSLVAIAEAVTALRAGQCRMALAGGVAITVPVNSGYRHEAGSMLSPDGRTRSFDADAQGTVFSDGAAVVLLKRLADARRDGDTIHAVIRGVGINNDGGDKASFTAPSVDGQHAVIRAALDDAGLPARSIQHVEAHGTATPMGDPVEVAAITRAWREETADTGFAVLSSLKSYLGHTVIAAGAASTIKTVLALKHGLIPGTLHYKAPNPGLRLEQSPFRVTAEHTPWPVQEGVPRRAGISAFGVGGTNAHIIIEEAPADCRQPANAAESTISDADGERLHFLPLSARTDTALATQRQQLAAHLRQHPADLNDVAFTLYHGRSPMNERQCVLAATPDEAISALATAHSPDRLTGSPRQARRLAWLFPGQGAQYGGMGRMLYRHSPAFAAAFDEAAEAIGTLALPAAADGLPLSGDLRALVFDGSDADLAQTGLTQPALFALEYALARHWQSLGVEPELLIGHSLGEFAAAVIAGVMPAADAARLVATRGRLIQALPAGEMLAVRQPADEVRQRLPDTLSVATINADDACVVAGPHEAIAAFAQTLSAEGVAHQVLKTSHAFHSAMMDDAVAPFEAAVAKVTLSAPRIPIISGRTGQPLGDAEATDPHYWSAQLRDTVRFADAARLAVAEAGTVFLEVGPGQVLGNLVRRAARGTPCIASLGNQPGQEVRTLARARAQLWCLDRASLASAVPAAGRRIALPTYPFEGKTYWLPAPPASATAAAPLPLLAANAPVLEPAASPLAAAATAVASLRALVQARAVGQSVDAPLPVMPLAANASAIAVTSRPAANPAAATAALPAGATLTSVPDTRPAGQDVSTHSSPSPDEPSHTMNAPSRQDRLHTELAETIDGVCGIAIGTDERQAAFVDLGLDSLLLTQLALQLKRHFGTPISFRQLMTDLPTPAALVEHLDKVLPADAFAAAAPSAAAPSQPAGAPANGMATPLPVQPLPVMAPSGTAPLPLPDSMQQLINQQLQLMEAQLRLLTGQGMPVATAVQAAQPAMSPGAPAPSAPVQAPAAAAQAGSRPAPGGADKEERATDDPKKAFGALARIYRQQQAEKLTPRQESRLDAFIKRYVDKTRKSRDFTQQHRPHSADPRVVNGFRPRLKEMIYQIVIEKSKGSHLWDLDGNEYVDALNGFGMSMFGWQPDFVVDAVRKQIDLGYDIGPQHPLSGPVTELVCEMTGFDRAALCNTGSEAVMGAVRIARTVTGRDRIAVFSGAYHGIFDEVIVRIGARGKAMPAAPGIMPNTAENVVILDYGSPEALEWVKANADTLAAVLVEPVQSRRPELQPREFLHELRRITTETGSLLIFDEVVTGFRTGPGGAQAHFDIRADLASYGKVIGGGFPIGIIAGKREYMDALDGGAWQYGDDSIPTVGVTYFAGTFVRHPLALAACHAVLLHLKKAGPELQQKLSATTTGLAETLNTFCEEHGAPIRINHFASVWRVVFTEDHPYQDLLFAMMRNRGIHILDNFPCFMTTAHTPEDVEAICKAFCESVLELQADGFLPGAPKGGGRKAAAGKPDPRKPPVPGARLGRDAEGKAAWFVADPERPGAYIQLKTGA